MKIEYIDAMPDPVTGARALTPASSSSLLTHLVSQCESRLMIFDLDSTLLDNRARNAKITQEFAELNDEPSLRSATAKHWQDWSASNAMGAMGLSNADNDFSPVTTASTTQKLLAPRSLLLKSTSLVASFNT